MHFSWQQLNPKYLGLSGTLLFLFGSLFGFIGFPRILESQIASNLALKKGSEIRAMWSKIPIPLEFKAYIFNVTNPMDVQKGGKPALAEVGPYVYLEYKDKLDFEDHNEDDTVSFNPRDTWYFSSQKSGALTGDEPITIPHIAMLVMALAAERERPVVLKLINKAIPSLFENPSSMFITTTARRLLFEGIPLYCNATDFSSKAICSELRKRGEFGSLGDDVLSFSLFGKKNATAGGRMRVKRGIKNIKQLGEVVEYMGQEKLSVWSGDPCNTLTGSDSTIYPPFLTTGDYVTAFSPELCRGFAAYHTGNITYKGIKAYTYSADFGDAASDPEMACYCPSEKSFCKKGMLDLTSCMGAPIIVSLPHFYLADREYQTGVLGINASKEKHEIFSIFEPLTSTPLMAHRRVQLSLPLHSIDSIDLMKQAPTVLLPIIWIEEGVELSDTLLKRVRVIFKAITAMDVIKWIAMVLGAGFASTGFWLFKRKQQGSMVDIEEEMRKVTSRRVEPKY